LVEGQGTLGGGFGIGLFCARAAFFWLLAGIFFCIGKSKSGFVPSALALDISGSRDGSMESEKWQTLHGDAERHAGAMGTKQLGMEKKVGGIFYENAMLRGAACLQANTLKEADDFRAYGLKSRIEIVPNGVDLPDTGKAESGNAEKLKEGKKRLLFLGRIHPKKGLVALLKAWADIQNSKSKTHNSKQWQFVIAGWDQGGHEAQLKNLCGELGLRIAVGTTKDTNSHELEKAGWCLAGKDDSASSPATNYSLPATAPQSLSLDSGRSTLDSADVHFFGPAFGEEKDALLRSADAFVLPSFSEGLPMSVLEAWSYGLPVVMTPECNLPEGFAKQAAQEIRNSAGGFEGIRTLIGMTDQERAAMGMRGRKLVEEKFTWQKVASQLKEIYESLL